MARICRGSIRTRLVRATLYRLPLDNNGEPWRWISNFQVIVAVDLKKHPTLPRRIWQMPKDDQKTVSLKFTDMLSASDAPSGAPSDATASGDSAAITLYWSEG
eukprot:7378089-Prymnesium_polylepis.1